MSQNQGYMSQVKIPINVNIRTIAVMKILRFYCFVHRVPNEGLH